MDPVIVAETPPQRLYCGDKNPLPPGYAGYDTRFRCLRKGVGIGLYKIRQGNGPRNAGNAPPPPRLAVVGIPWWRMVPWWVWGLVLGILVLAIVLLFLYFGR